MKGNQLQVKNHDNNSHPSVFKSGGKKIPIVESRYSFKRSCSECVPENHEDMQFAA